MVIRSFTAASNARGAFSRILGPLPRFRREKMRHKKSPRAKKAPRGFRLAGLFCVLIRQHLLSRFWHYHRLEKLNYRVRNGNGCGLFNMVTGKESPAGISPPTTRLVVFVLASVICDPALSDHE